MKIFFNLLKNAGKTPGKSRSIEKGLLIIFWVIAKWHNANYSIIGKFFLFILFRLLPTAAAQFRAIKFKKTFENSSQKIATNETLNSEL